jgi:hypothetical protein
MTHSEAKVTQTKARNGTYGLGLRKTTIAGQGMDLCDARVEMRPETSLVVAANGISSLGIGRGSRCHGRILEPSDLHIPVTHDGFILIGIPAETDQ